MPNPRRTPFCPSPSTPASVPIEPLCSTGPAPELEPPGATTYPAMTRDPLTGLLNPDSFDVELGGRLQHCRDRATTAGLILLTVDRFGWLTENYGNHVREEVLPHVARALQDSIRSADVSARYRFDKFGVLAIGPTDEGLATICERIRAAVQAQQIDCRGNRLSVTASIGAVLGLPRRADPGLPARLLTAAEQALSEAAVKGNRVRVCSLLSPHERRVFLRISERRFSRWLVNRCVLDAATVSLALIRYDGGGIPLCDIAVQRGLLKPEQARQIDRNQSSISFAETVIQLGLLEEERVAWLMAVQQEDPDVLAQVLVRMGLLERRQAAQLLAEYMAAAHC